MSFSNAKLVDKQPAKVKLTAMPPKYKGKTKAEESHSGAARKGVKRLGSVKSTGMRYKRARLASEMNTDSGSGQRGSRY